MHFSKARLFTDDKNFKDYGYGLKVHANYLLFDTRKIKTRFKTILRNYRVLNIFFSDEETFVGSKLGTKSLQSISTDNTTTFIC